MNVKECHSFSTITEDKVTSGLLPLYVMEAQKCGDHDEGVIDWLPSL
jgi:hypothetical protein